MDQRVGGREQLAHAIGEADHAYARMTAIEGLEALPDLLVAAAERDHERLLELEA